jgi:hypothetical protein
MIRKWRLDDNDDLLRKNVRDFRSISDILLYCIIII